MMRAAFLLTSSLSLSLLLAASCASNPPPPVASATLASTVVPPEKTDVQQAALAKAPAPIEGVVQASYTGPNPCKVGGRGDSPVDRACNEGGVKAAKLAMRDLVKKGKAQGVKFQCDDCHTNTEDMSQLGDSAKEKFKQLVEAASKG
jgi:hypothetical protein